MQPDKTIIDQMLDRQKRMFRIAQDPQRYGLTLKIIAADSGLGYDSIRNYAAGETQMPLSALDALIGVIPDELLSLLLPAGRRIVMVPDNIDHDALCEAMQDYLCAKHAAHHPESEAGRDIGPVEHERLCGKVTVLKAVAA